MERFAKLLPVAPLAAAAIALAAVDVGLFAVGPGPSRDVLPRIDIGGARTYRTEGHLLLTTVQFVRVDVFNAIRGWLDPAVEVKPERDVVPAGQSEEEFADVARSQMDESKIAAAVVVLELLTDYPEEHGDGVLVQDVLPGSPADGRLFEGDLITLVDGDPVADSEQVSDAIAATEGRRALDLRVEAGGEERDVRIRPRHNEELRRPVVGVILVENFPFDIVIESGNIGGPSAGLMWALGTYDLLTPGDLADGRTIAGTGEIALDGTVGAIGGIEQKVIAAEAAGADLLLVPARNLEAARAVEADIDLAPVETFADALAALGAG